jgi:hypothetical protein
MDYDPDALDLHDAREDRWKEVKRARDFLFVDALAAVDLPVDLPKNCRVQVFRIISESSLDELRGMFTPKQQF